MDNEPVGGCSSETQSHHIDINNNNKYYLDNKTRETMRGYNIIYIDIIAYKTFVVTCEWKRPLRRQRRK
jgi:hypothetical protein